MKTRSRGASAGLSTLIRADAPLTARDLGFDAMLEAALAGSAQRQTLMRAQAQVTEFFNGDESRCELWFAAENPMLGGISPIQMIRMGQLDRLAHFIDESLSANEPPSSLPA